MMQFPSHDKRTGHGSAEGAAVRPSRSLGRACRLAMAAGLALWTSPGLAQDAGGVSPLVDRVLAAYGGAARLAAVSAYEATGTLTAGHAQRPAATRRVVAGSRRLRIELGYAEGRELRLLEGPRGWRTGRGGSLSEAEGPLLDSMVLQWARAWLPWILDERRADVRLGSSVEAADELLESLVVALEPGLEIEVWVEADSGRISRVVGRLATPGMQIEFLTRYSDYRTVDGVLFPFHEDNFAGSQHTASTVFDEVRFAAEVPEEPFRP